MEHTKKARESRSLRNMADNASLMDNGVQRMNSSLLRSNLWKRREFWFYLVGTGGTWFLFDLAYFGTVLFGPDILRSIFSDTGDVMHIYKVCIQSIIATFFGWIGAWLAILFIKKWWTAKKLNSMGMILNMIAFMMLAVARRCEVNVIIQLVLFSFVSGTLNFGPNVATYILPTEVFPKEVETQSCTPACSAEPVDCEITEWSMWSTFAVTCAGGEIKKARTRTSHTEKQKSCGTTSY